MNIMKFTNLFKLAVIGWITIGLSGCFPDNSSVYDGSLQVEFRPTSDSQSMADGNIYDANIQLIGPHQDAPLLIEYEVDTENSTAILGEHFELDGFSTEIPANSSFGTIQITALEENIDQEYVVTLTLLGDESGNVIAAHNYRTLQLTLTP